MDQLGYRWLRLRCLIFPTFDFLGPDLNLFFSSLLAVLRHIVHFAFLTIVAIGQFEAQIYNPVSS